MNEIRNKILSSKTIFLDTAPVIYYIEKHREYGSIVQTIVDCFSAGEIMAFTSVITITEVLAKPVADGKDTIVDQFIQFFKYGKNIKVFDIDSNIAVRAGKLRGLYSSIKTLDAIQIATALEAGTSIFVTNDKRLRVVQDIELLVLDDYLQ